MLEKMASLAGKRFETVIDKILPEDRHNALEFIGLINDVLGKDVNLSHFNNLEVYIKIKQDGRKRYFLKEELFKDGKFYTDYYISGGTRLIFKRVEFGELTLGADEKISGSLVKDMDKVRAKIQKIKNPLGVKYDK